jgi:hypothetical protein
MRRRTAALFVFASSWALVPPVTAKMYVYPQKGQTAEQQSKDEGECHQWAVEQSGSNPALASSPETGADGSLIRGGARGAAVGAVAGAIAGDAGKGAAAGAAGGALIGGMKRRDRRRTEENARASDQNEYRNAFVACLQGRGYSVN